VEEVEELLGLEPGDVSLILRPLHSLLKLDPRKNSIQVHHASFRDFLNSQERSSIFYIGSREHQRKLAHSIFKVLSYTYEDPQKNHGGFSLQWYLSTYIFQINN
jgi:hypothetical protein